MPEAAQTPAPAPAAPTQPAVPPAVPAAATNEPAASPPAEPPKPPMPPPVVRRINHLTREAAEANGRAAAVEEENKRLREQIAKATGQPSPSAQPPATEDAVRAKAAELMREQQFVDASNRAFDTGKKEFPDFEAKLGNLAQLGGFSKDTVEAIVSGSDMAHKVLYHLAGNLDVAADLMSMPPMQRARFIGRLEAQLSAPAAKADAEDTKAPAPTRPVGGRSPPPSGPNDKDDTATWMAKRRAQLKAKRA